MKTLAIVSFFRNSAVRGHLGRFFEQVISLRTALSTTHTVKLIAVEGDSTDQTRDALAHLALHHNVNMDLVIREHGQRWFDSTEEPERLKALSWLGNGGLEAVQPTDDEVLYVESDLIWDAGTIARLLGVLRPGVDIVSPLIFAGNHFYDVFCFRSLEGKRFSPFGPFSDTFAQGNFVEVGSVGSCLIMKGEVARNTRIPGSEVLIGFCRVAREQGYHIFVDAQARVNHP